MIKTSRVGDLDIMWQAHPKVAVCAELMRCGGVVAYPTEAVWGLGCDPYNRQAVETILSLKGRHWHKGLILVAADISHIDFLLEGLNREQMQKLEASWPGHTTWLLPHNNCVPKFVHGLHDTIAVRVSAHPLVAALCRHFNGPIISTSANPQGLPPAKTLVAARRYFKDSGISFAPGVIGRQSEPSKIIDLLTGIIVR